MSEPSDIERAARVCEELAEKAGRHAESCADVDRETSEQFTEAETWLVMAAEKIRALQPDPVAEAERRLERLLAGDALEALAREDIACLLDELDRCPGCFACDVRRHAQELEALRRAREEVDRA